MLNSRNIVITNLLWRFGERTGAQIVSFIVQIILARIIEPVDFGVIALITVFINILQVFVDSGLANALIQKKDADIIDFSSVFYANIIFCIVIYLLLFLFAPLIAHFYDNNNIISLIRVLGIIIIVSGVKNVQQAYVARNLLFKKFFISTIIGTIVAAVFGIVLALNNFSVWAIVAQQLMKVIIDTVILWITVKWRPSLVFSFSKLKNLFRFGWKLLFTSILDTIYRNTVQLLIGRLYTSADLAFYNRGQDFPSVIGNNVNNSIESVLFPILSTSQDDIGKLKEMTRRSIKTSVFIMTPIMISLFVLAPDIVHILLTDKWVDSIPYIRIFCVVYIFLPINTSNLSAIKALGRSDIVFMLEVVKKTIGMILLLITIRKGVIVLASSMIVFSFVNQILNSAPNKKLLKYGYGEQIKDIFPDLFFASIMGLVMFVIGFLPLYFLLRVLLQILIGCCFYLLSAKIVRNESYVYIFRKCVNKTK